ncbi:lactate permease LctP family transporter [Brochothrix campestris]|uniref:L-lactate permease n=1 Tax=Brochothrix campestris FSL F6-1037 TaxID=1265861 RepID=W7CJI6_9LIST|nr:lactate permease LctP family transporter [Brochothrix campestris]EUJ36995.1 L-lactate permease [Brochothrix campestris FSL F6-1037]
MNEWMQIYNPLDNIALSGIVAALPIITFLLCLTVFKLQGYISGLISIIVAAIIAMTVYDFPIQKVFGATTLGVLSAIWPVASIIITAIFLYKLTVKTGYFEIIKSSITSVTADQRIQVIIVAFAFGAFLEGAAGFGAPVAITAAILVGLGFKPLYAAGLCLLANIAGGAYGAMGIPVSSPALLTGLDALDVSAYTSVLMPILSIIIVFILIFAIDGFKGIRQTLPAILVSGGVFAGVQYLILNTIGPALVDIFAALASLIALIILLRFWQPKDIYRINKAEKVTPLEQKTNYSMTQIIFAWLPFILLTVFVTVLNLNPVKALFAAGGPLEKLIFFIQIPGLHNTVIQSAPVVEAQMTMAAIFKLDLFTNTTTAIALAGLLTMIIFKVSFKTYKDTAIETVKELWRPILTICSVLALSFICTYSGISATMGIALASTGSLFPLFSPVLGWLGVFLTGSVVNSGSLFAPLQAVTATQIGVDPAFLVAINVLGGDMAKMLSPQSIAVATAAVGLVGRESQLFKFTVKYSISFLIIVGLFSLFYSMIFM